MKKIWACIRNFFFLLKYPFWQIYSLDYKPKKYYSYTWYDEIPDGWKDSFGKQLSKDLRRACKQDHVLHKLRISTIKEKYGSLQIYVYSVYSSFSEVDKVISYYEDLSMCYCINCGEPVRYITSGYILFLCPNCFKEQLSRIGFSNKKEKIAYILKHRAKISDIPHRYHYSVDEHQQLTKQEYQTGVDFIKLWDIKVKKAKKIEKEVHSNE